MGTVDDSITRVKGDSATPVHITNTSLPSFTAGGGGGPATIADGADVAQGTTTNAAVVTDTSGTVIGFLRGLVKWAFERMPAALGQGTMAQSLRVVLPSDQTGANAIQVRNGAATSFADATSNTTIGILDSAGTGRAGIGAFPYGFNGATWDRLRTSNVFKTAIATASGDTVAWDPAAGKKFRVIAYAIEITADAATAGGAVIDFVLRDATTPIGMGFSVFVPAVAGTAFGNSVGTGWRTLGNGYLSAAANNDLNINLSAALTSGKVRVNVIGTEE